MRLSAPILVAGIVLLFSSSREGFACEQTRGRACPSPSGCSDDYCEQWCRLEDESGDRCIYRCFQCQCGGIIGSEPRCGLSLLAGFFATKASAAEPKAPEKQRETAVSNQDGDFLIVEGVAGTPRSDSGAVGLRIAKKEQDLVVAETLKGSPAQKAGIEAGDVLVSIDGRSARGMSLEIAGKSLRGMSGTLVVVKIKRKSDGKIAKLSLIRTADALASLPFPKGEITYKDVPLKTMKEDSCPPALDGCNYLVESRGVCTYTCKKKQD